MGISPIANLASLPLTPSVLAELEPVPMERVESTARTGDETYTPSNKKATRGSEDAGSEDDAEDDFEDLRDQNDPEDAPRQVQSAQPRPISFFA